MDRRDDDARHETDSGEALNRRSILLGGASLVALTAMVPRSAEAQAAPPATQQQASGDKPNIVVIFGDDIGLTNVSAYSFGLMGYRTPNIDRIAKEGMMFTDYYAEQSCTAGRSSFITGQTTLRTGLSKVGLPAATVELQAEDITIAEALKPLGYATGQFGKNHLGDRNEYLPTVHGFDEFFGNLYHLNAEEEPENPDYPKDPAFKAKFGPRGVIKSFATDTDDQTVDPRWGKVGKQKIEDTGALTKKRMETIDDETVNAAIDFIKRQVAAGRPFFLWYNATRMHLYTHVRPEMLGRSGISEYFDGMLEHDDDVGKILKVDRRSRHRRQHHPHLHHRQRPAYELMAGWCDDAVPRREEHKLGRRFPRAGDGPLARAYQARQRIQRDRLRPRLVPDAACRGR